MLITISVLVYAYERVLSRFARGRRDGTMDSMDMMTIVVVLVVILVSMTLHEAMHGFMAYWLGDDTAKEQGRLTLNPIHHIDPFLTLILPLSLAVMGLPVFGGAKPVPFDPDRVRGGEWGAASVALAGPLTNFVLAFICFGVYAWVAPLPVLTTAIGVNLGFFVFNMLPIPPLDGSRVMYALAPEFVRRGMEFIERYGVVLVFVIVLLASSTIGTIMATAVSAIIRLFAMIFGVSVG